MAERTGVVRRRAAGVRFGRVAVYAIFRHSTAAGSREFLLRPRQCFAFLIALSAICYLPLLIWFGPARWFSFWAIRVQASRIGLYGVYMVEGDLPKLVNPSRVQKEYRRELFFLSRDRLLRPAGEGNLMLHLFLGDPKKRLQDQAVQKGDVQFLLRGGDIVKRGRYRATLEN